MSYAESTWDSLDNPKPVDAHPFADVERLFVMSRPQDDNVPSTARFPSLVQNFRRELGTLDDPTVPDHFTQIPTAATVAGMQAIFERYRLTSSDAIAIIGGDGTKGNANAAALLAGFGGIIHSIAGGNADDQTHMLFRRRDVAAPAHAMPRSRQGKLNLLEIVSDQPNTAGEHTVYTTGYISFGDLVSSVAAEVSSPAFRDKTVGMQEFEKFVAETGMMLGKVGAGRLITIEDNDGTRTRSDVLLTNGQRMAKTVRFAGVNLLRPGYGRVELKRSTIPAVVGGLGKAGLGLFKHMQPEDGYEFSVTSQDEAPVHVQRDGEFDTYPSGTKFTVRAHERPLRFATTRKV